jgi:hypothetical protein
MLFKSMHKSNEIKTPRIKHMIRVATCILFKQGVCHNVAFAIYIIRKYLKAKEELWKLKYISLCKNIILKKKL